MLLVSEEPKCNLFIHCSDVVSYLFSLTISVVHVGQDKINPAHSVTEEHRVFAVLLFVNLQRERTEVTRFKYAHIRTQGRYSLWMHSAQQTKQSNYGTCQRLTAKKPQGHGLCSISHRNDKNTDYHVFTANTNSMLNGGHLLWPIRGFIYFSCHLYGICEREEDKL